MVNLKLKEFSTIIIVNKDRQTKSLRIWTGHIRRFKYYLWAVGLVFTILIVLVIHLHSESNLREAQNRVLTAHLQHYKQQKPATIRPQNKLSPRDYIQTIERKLQTINDYLKRRGIKGFSTQNLGSGGNGNAEKKLNDSEVYALYSEYLNKLVTNMAFTPLGYPKNSSFGGYGYRSDPFNSARAEFHPGLDFQGKKGEAVRCTANGRVIYAGWFSGYGNCVRIAHNNGIETLYGHLSKIFVKVGRQVSTGDTIGAVGSTGHSTGPHLHYEVRVNGRPVNPRNYLTLNN
jgi:murein DD-endopeptidase MepM/ murein hydrolase activator NlpD